jgi:uncharacterized protein YuzE
LEGGLAEKLGSVSYDPEADAVYVGVGSGSVAQTRSLDDNRMVDMTVMGQ